MKTSLVPVLVLAGLAGLVAAGPSMAADAPGTPAVAHDPALAARLGADPLGMRRYTLVILRSSDTPVPRGTERDAMFAGHMANIERLAAEGKLVLAGPFISDPAGWRGLFVLATESAEEAASWVGTDPVIAQGEMLAEYHPWYATAVLGLVPELHPQVVPPQAAP